MVSRKTVGDGANRLQCQALHFCAAEEHFGAGGQTLNALLDK
jgi:hypothetical protein